MTFPTAAATLQSQALDVVVRPDFGARVVALTDRRTGRNWLAVDRGNAAPGDGESYGVAEAAGWDECFPTVAPCGGEGAPWGPALRDHGDLWGRPWRVDAVDARSLTASFSGPGYRFTRSLVVDGASLVADYRVDNQTARPMPFLWSQHALLALEPGERIELFGVDEVVATWLSAPPPSGTPLRARWPDGGALAPFALDEVQPTGRRFAGKFYASGGQRRARVGGAGGRLELAWDGVEHLGLWLAYGGWPVANEILHVAIEPTHAPVDHLQAARAMGAAPELAPGASARWRVTMRVEAGSFPGRSR